MGFEEIRIENTNICAMNCIMCPRKLMSREKGRMTYDNFVSICTKLFPYLTSSKLNWLDLHGFGEPLMDKDLFRKIEFVKNTYPNVKTRIVTTFHNVTLDDISSVLSSGLTEIVISHYATSEAEYQRIYGVSGFENTRTNINTLLSLNHESGDPLGVLIENISFEKFMSGKQEEKRIFNLASWHESARQMGAIIRDVSTLHNWGSAFSYKDISQRTCSVVNGYRKRILQITWDGKIIPCCFDYNADVVFGNMFKDTVEEVYSSATYNQFISSHCLNNLNNYPPCKKCSRCLLS